MESHFDFPPSVFFPRAIFLARARTMADTRQYLVGNAGLPAIKETKETAPLD